MTTPAPSYAAEVLATEPGLTRGQLHRLFVDAGLQRNMWLVAPLVLLSLWLVERLVGAEAMIKGLQTRSPLCFEQAKMLVDAYIVQKRAESPFGIKWTQMSLESYRRAQFVSFAIGAPSGYGIQVAMGMLTEIDRKIDYWLGMAGLPERM